MQVLPAKGCPWSRQGRVEQGEIAESVRPAVSLDLLGVKGQDLFRSYLATPYAFTTRLGPPPSGKSAATRFRVSTTSGNPSKSARSLNTSWAVDTTTAS